MLEYFHAMLAESPKRAIMRNWPSFERIRGARVALCVGIFDGIHRGHLALFNVVRELSADFAGIPLIFTFENHPLTVLEPTRPIKYLTLPDEKLHLLNRFGFDYIACFRFTKEFSEMTAREFLERVKNFCDLRVLVAGYDAVIGHDKVNTDQQFNRLARELGFEFIRIPMVKEEDKPVSSRAIREAVMNGDIPVANKMLVYPFFVRGKVVAGKGVGEKMLKFPTANILVPSEKILPPTGVYAGSFRREGRHTASAICVSDQSKVPLFLKSVDPEKYSALEREQSQMRLVEAHVIGKKLCLKETIAEFIFLERLRDWQDFESAEELRKRINEDVSESIRVFQKHRLNLQFLP